MESGVRICIASCWIMRRRAPCACCGSRRSPGFIRKARWLLENWCARAGLWAPTEPVPASAAGQSWSNTSWTHPRTKICASRCRVTPWTAFMELHWVRRCQVYVTPVSREEVCVAMISSSPKLRLRPEDALGEFPELCARLENAEHASSERGAITVTRRLRRVYRRRTVWVAAASGGVDAITGDGLCLTFRQAALLGDCLASGDLARYQKGHRTLIRRPARMSRIMLLMARHRHLRQRTLQVFQSSPRSFAGMLAMHVGEGSARHLISNGIALGWELLKA